MKKIALIISLCFLVGCATTQPPLNTVRQLDLNQYMGKWYVIACIPVFIEAKAYNEIEEYNMLEDGTINTVLSFNHGSFNGPRKKYNPKGFVVDKINNSTWKMQFIWPFKTEYLVTYISHDYRLTVVSRNKRDYVWIMARTPQIPDADYEQLLKEIKAQGYDLAKLRKVPQQH